MTTQKRDKDGKALEEFLAEYDGDRYKKPALTSDVVLFAVDGERPVLLLVRRGNHPCLGDWAFPGGFVDESESCEEAAARELCEETGLREVTLEQLYTVSTPGRDPRGWTVSNCFFAVIESPVELSAGDDASDAAWFGVDFAAVGDLYEMLLKSGDLVLRCEMEIKRDAAGKIDVNRSVIKQNDGIAFDHAKLILYALEKL